jgi:pimeloyl-ACP methyl ester carboxylesterase
MHAGQIATLADGVLAHYNAAPRRARRPQSTRVCTYDRAGMGWSDPGPLPRSPATVANELHALLENGSIAGPYILVAHSLAGKNARLFAAAHPNEMAGMVLVDARSERIDLENSRDDAARFDSVLEAQAAIYSLARRLGIARLFAPEMALETRPAAIEAALQEGLARSVDDSVLATMTLGTTPLVVIASADSMRTIPGWPQAQEALAALSSNGALVVARNSGHYVQFDEPQLIVSAVRGILSRGRADN